MPAAAKVRLHVAHPVGEGQTVPVGPDQAHYLFGVMRLGVGDRLFVFDQTSGEWLAEVTQAGKRAGSCAVSSRRGRGGMPADVWLIFAPIRKERTDFIVEKAVELGAAVIQPVRTEFTKSERVRTTGSAPMPSRRPSSAAGPWCRRCGSSRRSTGCWRTGPTTGGSCSATRGARGPGGPFRGGARPLGDPDRPRGRVFGGRARAAFGAALRDGGEPRPPHPARRHRGGGGADAVAGGARGLG
jgi:hypothetical protein